ncbi:replication initiation factor [Paenibacillus abyssi]|uniref:Replication initiation factor n=1 Tax=Paenibacillus abyssi TaxID=1340531 RepID=A0A917D4E1_9BACL|nr:replication initiation factor [Paenibacillus abyssi]GGG09642.1 hypothetical protein GCM10010916_28150 [Paenibacillus abyssi]
MILKGIDTFEFGLEISNYRAALDPYLSRFKDLKEQAQHTGIESTIQIGGVELTVHRSGQKLYAYRLSCKDFLIAFMENESKNNAPVFVRFLSSFLWSYGLDEAYLRFLDWFKNLNVLISGNKLSRVDVCLDSEEISFREEDVKGVVTRATSKSKYFVNQEFTTGRQFSGFQIGRGDPMLARIYNKTIEIQKSGKEWFYEIWSQHNWDSSKEVWRVEFQLRRKAIKELGISTYEQFILKQKELWSYLTIDWLSIRRPTTDNISRWKIKRKWKIVQKAHLDYVPSPLIREVIKQGNLKQLLDQATGLMLSVAAISDHDSISETSEVLKSWFDVKMRAQSKTFESEKLHRQSKFILK